MKNEPLHPHLELLQFVQNKWVFNALWVAAKLGVADLLDNEPKETAWLAEKIGADEPSLYRVLRALASIGIFDETAPREFALNSKAAPLRVDAPFSVRNSILFQGDPRHDRAWSDILHSVKTGKPAFDHAFGKPIFDYFAMDSDFSEVFNSAMTAGSRSRTQAVLEAYDFSGIRKLIDVGGGHGELISAILKKYRQMMGGVVDMAHVISGTRERIKTEELSERCEAIAGNFFDALPSADAFIMSHIIHDWDDERCQLILKNCFKALPAGGKVLLVEMIIGKRNEPSFAKLLDLEMLIMTPGGKERTEEEYQKLFATAGFHLTKVVQTKGPHAVIEAVKD